MYVITTNLALDDLIKDKLNKFDGYKQPKNINNPRYPIRSFRSNDQSTHKYICLLRDDDAEQLALENKDILTVRFGEFRDVHYPSKHHAYQIDITLPDGANVDECQGEIYALLGKLERFGVIERKSYKVRRRFNNNRPPFFRIVFLSDINHESIVATKFFLNNFEWICVEDGLITTSWAITGDRRPPRHRKPIMPAKVTQ